MQQLTTLMKETKKLLRITLSVQRVFFLEELEAAFIHIIYSDGITYLKIFKLLMVF